jgi:Flp pilus assembly protein TadD
MAADVSGRASFRSRRRLLLLLGALGVVGIVYLCLPKSWFEIPRDNAAAPISAPASAPLQTQDSGEKPLPPAEPPIASLRDDAARSPLDFGARSRYGMALAAAGRGSEAWEEFQAAERLAPDSPGVHHNLGVYYLNSRRLAQADAEFSRELELAPGDGRAHYFRGLIFQARHQDPQAAAQFREAIALAPQLTDAYLSLAMQSTRSGKEPEVRALIDHYIRLNGDKTLAYYVLSGAYRTWKDYTEAARYAEMTVQQDPNNYGYWHNLGQIYAYARRWDDADRTLHRAQALAHDPTTVLIELGMNAQSAGRFANAADYFHSALDASPKMGSIHHYLAHVYHFMGRETEEKAEERAFRIWQHADLARRPHNSAPAPAER